MEGIFFVNKHCTGRIGLIGFQKILISNQLSAVNLFLIVDVSHSMGSQSTDSSSMGSLGLADCKTPLIGTMCASIMIIEVIDRWSSSIDP